MPQYWHSHSLQPTQLVTFATDFTTVNAASFTATTPDKSTVKHLHLWLGKLSNFAKFDL